MTRLDVSFLGRQPGLIVREFKDITNARKRTFTRDAVVLGLKIVGVLLVFWLLATVWFLV